jgi:hypothetical protein
MKFFTALIGTCKGTKVFLNLLSQSLNRAFFHLLLLALICSLFIVLCTYPKNSQEVNNTFTKLEETFGEIQVSKKGILSEKIHKTRSFPVSEGIYRITYIQDIDKAKLPEIDADDVNSGFLWTPTMLTSWFKIGPDKFFLIPFAYFSDRQLSIETIPRSSILTYIKNNTSLKNELNNQYSELTWPALQDYCKSTLVSITFLGNLAGIILRVLFFVLMFSFILNLSGKNTGNPVLKYKTRYIIGIYASFPPLLVATMFRAFELPFLSFNSIYVIGFSLYLIVVYTQLQLNLNASGQDNTEQQNG